MLVFNIIRRQLKLLDATGDHMTLLHVYNAWEESGNNPHWAAHHFLHQRELERAQDVRTQLEAVMKSWNLDLVSPSSLRTSKILRSLCQSHKFMDKVL